MAVLEKKSSQQAIELEKKTWCSQLSSTSCGFK